MVFHSSLLSTKDPGPVYAKDPGLVYDNIYGFRLPIFEEITTLVDQVNLCIAVELQNSKQAVLLE